MKNKVVIVGSGGHAKVIIDIIRSMKKYEIIGLTSINSDKKNITGIPILGNDKILSGLFDKGIKNAFIAIGDCKLRGLNFDKVKNIGFNIINAISPFSNISVSVKLGSGIAIMPGVSINIDSLIEDNVIINTNASIDHDNIIRKNVHVAPGCNLAGNVTVGQGSFLGVGTKVIPGIKIGEWATIGAGSVVIKDVPSYTTSVGVPSRIIKHLKNK